MAGEHAREPTAPVHRALGLTDEEAAAIGRLLGRQPNHLELAMYAVMWSEHCSYKSSRVHLKRLPTEGPHVLVDRARTPGWSTRVAAWRWPCVSKATITRQPSNRIRGRRRVWAAS